jgi:DNA-binding transcriptional ArsR family regulator
MANDTFKALAHPLRRRVVERLAAGPATVAEATRGFGVAKPTLSRHLKVLEEAGVIARVIDGRTHRLTLDPAPLDEAGAWLETQRARWTRLFDVVEDYLEEQEQSNRAR